MQIGLPTLTPEDQLPVTSSCSTTEQLRGKVDVNLRWQCRQWSRSIWLKELKWIRTLLAELGYSNGNGNPDDEPPTDLFSDNQSAIALAKNSVSHARAKHIDIRHHFVREAIQDKVIWVQYIPTTEMTADSLTKALGREKHENVPLAWG